MINSNPNPKMSRDEIVSFRRSVMNRMLGNLSNEESRALSQRKLRIETTAKRIINNNGGKTQSSGINIIIKKLSDDDYRQLSSFSCGTEKLDSFSTTNLNNASSTNICLHIVPNFPPPMK